MVRYGDEKDGTSWHTSISIWFVRLFDAIHANSASPQTVRSVASYDEIFVYRLEVPSFYLLTVAFEYIATDGRSMTVVDRRPPSALLIYEK